jgi:hypothetical protein
MGLTLLGVPGCSGSAEEQAGVSFADDVRVSGFRRTHEYVKGEDTVILLVGPANADLFTAVTAPGWSPASPPPELPNADVLWDNVILSYATAPGEFRCRLGVDRLRPGHEPPTTDGLTEDEVRAIAAGGLSFLQVTVGCRKPE